MSLDASIWAWRQRVGRSTAKLVLLSIADRAGGHGTSYPSVDRLTYDTELDRKTVMTAVAFLERQGFITAERSPGRATTYTLQGFQDRADTARAKDTTNATKEAPPTKPTRPKNGTGSEIGTSPKNGTGPVPKTGHEPIRNQSGTEKERDAHGGAHRKAGKQASHPARPHPPTRRPRPGRVGGLLHTPQGHPRTDQHADRDPPDGPRTREGPGRWLDAGRSHSRDDQRRLARGKSRVPQEPQDRRPR